MTFGAPDGVSPLTPDSSAESFGLHWGLLSGFHSGEWSGRKMTSGSSQALSSGTAPHGRPQKLNRDRNGGAG